MIKHYGLLRKADTVSLSLNVSPSKGTCFPADYQVFDFASL